MIRRNASSRRQFEQEKALIHGRGRPAHGGHPQRRERSSLALVGSFLKLLHGHRASVILSLATLTAATLLALIPPAATKLVVDYVLGAKSLPATVPGWVPRDPWPLLLAITIGVLVISMVKTGLHIWGRWHATRVTKLIQMSVRKKVFAHAMRLPLHRVQELKSGGVASIVRQDAGSVGDLVFGILYNP